MRRERSMNSYEELCKELRKIHDSYKGNASQYTKDVSRLEVTIDGLTIDNYTLDSGGYYNKDASYTHIISNIFVLRVEEECLESICYLKLGDLGDMQVGSFNLISSQELFRTLPAKYKTPDGARLLSTLFKEATVKLQSTQDYNKWFANL